jgi:hypothetical protein
MVSKDVLVARINEMLNMNADLRGAAEITFNAKTLLIFCNREDKQAIYHGDDMKFASCFSESTVSDP